MAGAIAEGQLLAGRYQVERSIGAGGMASVYSAIDTLLDRRVAIKLLSREFADDTDAVARFRREARSAAGLNHRNIVAVHDFGQHEKTYFIVMEYVEGKSLSGILASGPIAPRKAAKVAADIALGLDFAHKNGVVHRDIKPGNILLTLNGVAKLADFGIARIEEEPDELTKIGSVVGTATYFAPEQARGAKGDSKSDLYSLGVVLYQMVSGQLPFTGATAVAVAYKHVQEAPPEIDDAFEVPEWLTDAIMRLLEKRPEDRFDSARDLVSALGFKIGREARQREPKVKAADVDLEASVNGDAAEAPTSEQPKINQSAADSTGDVAEVSDFTRGSFFASSSLDDDESAQESQTESPELGSSPQIDAPTAGDLMNFGVGGAYINSSVSNASVSSSVSNPLLGRDPSPSSQIESLVVVSEEKIPVNTSDRMRRSSRTGRSSEVTWVQFVVVACVVMFVAGLGSWWFFSNVANDADVAEDNAQLVADGDS